LQSVDKAPIKEASASRSIQEEDVDTLGPVYDDTKGVIDKYTSLKWGEFIKCFNNQTFPQYGEDDPDLKMFRNIKRSKLYKVAAHTTVFPCAEAISWIVKHVDLETRFILNAKGHPITSFQASIIASLSLGRQREVTG
jgi:hypothetical protein